jgi:hypothetical protein
MVLFFCTTLSISIVGLVLLLWVKRWELRTGRVVFAGVRPHVAELSHSTLVWFERVLPHLAQVYARRTARAAEDMLHHGAARGLLAAEHGLERVLQSLRGVTEQPRANREASVFLREVAEHKRKLLHRKKAKVQPEE